MQSASVATYGHIIAGLSLLALSLQYRMDEALAWIYAS